MSIDSRDVVTRTNEKIRKERKRYFKRRALVVAIVVVVFVVIVSFVSHRPGVQIATVTVLGTETLSVSDIEKVVHARIDGKYAYLFPRNTIFFLNKSRLERDIVTAYPRVETIDISIENRELLVLLSEREASYLWCGAEPFLEMVGETPCYYFDKSGFIFDSAPYFSAAVYFTLYDGLGVELGTEPTGQYVAHKDTIESLLSFVASLESLDIRGFALALDGNQATLYLGNTKDTDAPRVLWNVDDDYSILGSNLQSALRVEPMKSEVFDTARKLDYIDLRYSDKVYYKLKD
jgi:hypothetical protein